jgi:GR25 family glycosyltransferase involved in LPS biosynthesis
MTFYGKDVGWYYINLAHRKDRVEHIEKEFRRTGFRAHRFPAFTKGDFSGSSKNVAGMLHTPNTIGNWMSHTTLISWAQDRTIGVLEDDALLCSDFLARLEYIERNFHKSWDIFFLGGTFHDDRGQWHPELGRDHELTDTRRIVRLYGAWSNQGYIVNAGSGPKIVKMMREVMPQSTGSDHALIQIQPKLQCFGFVPGMVFQIDGPSDIGNGITKFSNFLRMGGYVWADKLEDFDYDAWEKRQKELHEAEIYG